jgi:hypothetical protein
LDLQFTSPRILLSGDVIAGNAAFGGASYTGGGIDVGSSTLFTIVGGAITGNHCSGGGGGVYASSAGNIENVVITGNDANQDGGGVDHPKSSGGTLHITTPSLITGNIGALGNSNIYGESATP